MESRPLVLSVTPEDVSELLRSKGVNSKTTAGIADAIAASLNGQELTKTQRERLHSVLGSPAVQSVISDMQKTLTSRSDNVSPKPTVRNVGQLYTTVQTANDQVNTSINQADVAESLKGKGIPSQKIDTLAAAIVARVNGQELTRTQRDVLRYELGRPSVQKVINELIQKKSNGVDSAQNRVYDKGDIGDRLSNEEKSASVAGGSSSHQAPNMSSEETDNRDIKSGRVLSNGQSLDNMAELYAEKVCSNRKWRWVDAFPNAGKLSKGEKASIKKRAIEKGLIPDVPVEFVKASRKKTYRYVDFDAAGLVKEKVDLPEYLWLETDAVQFKWLDDKIGGRPEGYTWHHSEKDGQMELVPMGVHRVYHHNGGRTVNHWAYRKGGR